MQDKINPQHLLQLASKAATFAYTPYSKFNVGACILYEDGSIFTGCNVENASYGLTLCAERNAIATAISNGKNQGLIAVAIYSPNAKLCYPCGACRQWIYEFSKNAMVIVEDSNNQPVFYSISDLLPMTFESSYLFNNHLF